jgi:hypothetical protein
MRHQLQVQSQDNEVYAYCTCKMQIRLARGVYFTLGDLRGIWDEHLRDAGVTRALKIVE